MDDVAVRIENVSKTFRLPHEKYTSIKSVFVNFYRRRRTYELQHALEDVSFEIKKGEFFGIIGRNGSGKSTLLKLMAGIYLPTKGEVKVNGSLTPFIELGVGFNPELTGRENVFLNGALLGFNRKQMKSMYKDIVEFAELERFMDQKLKNYSSGMQVRLAFSIAIRARSDILLLDEVLAVGDAIFKQKCYNYFHQLKAKGKTVLLVSHDVNVLRQYCTRGILLENGELVTEGQIDDVLSKYTQIISAREKDQADQQDAKNTSQLSHHGTGKVYIEKIKTVGDDGKDQKVFEDGDKDIVIHGTYTTKAGVESPVYGIAIKDAAGLKVFASNNLWTRQKSNDLEPGASQEVIWAIPNIFNSGEFVISAAVTDQFGVEIYDEVESITSFRVRKELGSSAIVNPPHKIRFEKPAK